MDGNQSAEETDSHTPKPPVEASDGMNGFFRAKSRTLIAKNRTLKNIMSSTPKQKQVYTANFVRSLDEAPFCAQ